MYTQEAKDLNQFLIQHKSCFTYADGDEFVLPKFNLAMEEISSKARNKSNLGQKRGRKRHGVYRK